MIRPLLRRSTKIQLILFVVITLLGVSYVGANTWGCQGLLGGNSAVAYADFPDSGGIFTNAEVTYRGVAVGQVGALTLLKNGVRVDLNIDDCNGRRSRPTADAADRRPVGDRRAVRQPRPADGTRRRTSRAARPSR